MIFQDLYLNLQSLPTLIPLYTVKVVDNEFTVSPYKVIKSPPYPSSISIEQLNKVLPPLSEMVATSTLIRVEEVIVKSETGADNGVAGTPANVYATVKL